MTKDKEKLVGEPEFSIEDLAITGPNKIQLMKIAVTLKIPLKVSWKEHNKICKEAIQKIQKEAIKAEKKLTDYFVSQGVNDAIIYNAKNSLKMIKLQQGLFRARQTPKNGN